MSTLKMKGILVAAVFFTLASCSKLEPEIRDPQSGEPRPEGAAPTPPTLGTVYNLLNQLVGQYGFHAMQEHTTDELMGPTRGTDWDDFGTWRKLHLHTWDGAHNQVNDVWNGFMGALFNSGLLAENSTGQTQSEANFINAYFRYLVVDFYGQLQYKPSTASPEELPTVYSRSEAIDLIIAQLEAALPGLPSFTRDKRNAATKEAAQFLLAKCYLNKAVYKQDPSSPAGPFSFASADMSKVIELCNAIDANSDLALSASYWDNFVWDNGSKSTESIFVRQNSQGINMRWYTSMGFHYNMTPSSWNGFTALSDLYNSFEDADIRKGVDLPGYTDKTGARVGFLVGQQRGPASGVVGDPIVDLKDRAGNPLIFTQTASIYFSDEKRGIRTNKYPLDPNTIKDGAWGSQNEFVFFRYADARLMKAEAILRGGSDPLGESAGSIVNAIRTARGASSLGTVDLTALLAERARELYLEAWRRNDLVRFEKFNAPVEERASASDAYRVVFPIPNIALASNPNLTQNFGY
jgi:hypothetical protein